MNTILRRTLAWIPLCIGLASPAGVSSQEPERTNGLWLHLGVGSGWQSCLDCEGRDAGLSGELSLGTHLNPAVAIGIGVRSWTRERLGLRTVASTVGLHVRLSPVPRESWFITAEVGVGALDRQAEVVFDPLPGQDAPPGTVISDLDREYGLGLGVGVGFDLTLTSHFSLTPYGSWFRTGALGSEVVQLGVGLTVR